MKKTYRQTRADKENLVDTPAVLTIRGDCHPAKIIQISIIMHARENIHPLRKLHTE